MVKISFYIVYERIQRVLTDRIEHAQMYSCRGAEQTLDSELETLEEARFFLEATRFFEG